MALDFEKDIFEVSTTTIENVVRTELENGKVKTWLKNSSSKMAWSFSFMVWTRAEEKSFWDWYKDDLASGSLTFTMKNPLDQDSAVEVAFTEEPEVSAGTYPRTVSCSVREE